MNLIFQALAILVVLLPGLLYRSAYSKGNWNYPLGRLGPVSEQIPKAILYAIFLNGLWAYFVSGIGYLAPRLVWPIDSRSIIYWLSFSFGKDQANFDHAVDALTRSPFRILAYFSGLYLVAWVAGYYTHVIVRSSGLDRKYRAWRFDNDWHYLLRGGILGFPDKDYNEEMDRARNRPNPDEYGGTAIAAIVDTKDKSLLYVGVLVEFYFNAVGDLDRLLLEGTIRRELGDENNTRPPELVIKVEHPTDQDSTVNNPEDAPTSVNDYLNKKGYRTIDGHFFVLRLSEIKTLNVLYLTKEDASVANKEAKEHSLNPRLGVGGEDA